MCRYLVKEEEDLILGIPLSVSPKRDSWLWHFDKKKGCFSVKSAYKVALGMRAVSERLLFLLVLLVAGKDCGF